MFIIIALFAAGDCPVWEPGDEVRIDPPPGCRRLKLLVSPPPLLSTDDLNLLPIISLPVPVPSAAQANVAPTTPPAVASVSAAASTAVLAAAAAVASRENTPALMLKTFSPAALMAGPGCRFRATSTELVAELLGVTPTVTPPTPAATVQGLLEALRGAVPEDGDGEGGGRGCRDCGGVA